VGRRAAFGGDTSEVESKKWKKGATAAPFSYCGRGRLSVSCRPSSSRPWLSSPLSFIPPFMWVSREHCSGCRLARSLNRNACVLHPGHKGWLHQATLIPDVDYGCWNCDVKHKLLTKVKKLPCARTRAITFSDHVRQARVFSSRRARSSEVHRALESGSRDR
jgi:hypothetical protein